MNKAPPHDDQQGSNQTRKAKRFSCKCGAEFPTKGGRKNHYDTCDFMKLQSLERSVREVTSPGSECNYCGRLLSMDDVLQHGKMIFLRIYEGTAVCTDCQEQDPYYPHKEEPMLYDSEVESYRQLRQILQGARGVNPGTGPAP